MLPIKSLLIKQKRVSNKVGRQQFKQEIIFIYFLIMFHYFIFSEEIWLYIERTCSSCVCVGKAFHTIDNKHLPPIKFSCSPYLTIQLTANMFFSKKRKTNKRRKSRNNRRNWRKYPIQTYNKYRKKLREKENAVMYCRENQFPIINLEKLII